MLEEMKKQMKVYATRVVLECLKCHTVVESELYRNVEIGRTARLFCASCKRANAHMAIAHIHTYEELDDVVWPPPPPPGVSISPIVSEAVEVDTDPVDLVHMEPVSVDAIPEGEGLEVLPKGDPEDPDLPEEPPKEE